MKFSTDNPFASRKPEKTGKTISSKKIEITEREMEITERSVTVGRVTESALYKLMQNKNAPSSGVAARVWDFYQQKKRELEQAGIPPQPELVLPDTLAKMVSENEWNAFLYELEDERIRHGEITPRVEEFIESREALSRSLLRQRERFQTESINVDSELMPDSKKELSPLYQELQTIIADVARELGFDKTPTLEITRKDEFNAFVLQAAKEGGESKGADIPLRVFIHAGFITRAQELLGKENKVLTKDQLAFLIGHELRHLKQPGYHIDRPPSDAEEKQRYEYDADMAAMDAMDRAGYNPQSAIELLELFQNIGARYGELAGHYMTRTHPVSENRIKELWREYTRPDRPFFSAEKTPEPIANELVAEAERLVRKERIESLQNAITIRDWEKIIDGVDADPDATVKDLELVGIELKRHMDIRAAIAIALHEFKTEQGLAKLLVPQANAIMHIRKQTEDDVLFKNYFGVSDHAKNEERLKIAIQASFFPTTIRYPEPRVAQILNQEKEDELTSGFEEQQRRPEQEERYVDIAFKHSFGNEIIDEPAFQSIQELFDPENPVAVDYWTFYSKFLGRRDPIETNPDELIAKARAKTINALSDITYFGKNLNYSYTGEDLRLKQLFLETFETPQPEVGETSGIRMGDLSKLKKSDLTKLKHMVEQRVSGYRKELPVLKETMPFPTAPPVLKESYSQEIEALEDPLSCINPESATLDGIGKETSSEILKDMTPFARVMDHYFRTARKIWARDFEPETVKDRFHIPFQKDEKVEQLLFDTVVSDYFFKPQGRERASLHYIHDFTIEDVRDLMPQYINYLRILPEANGWGDAPSANAGQFVDRKSPYAGQLATTPQFTEAYFGDAAHARTPAEIAEKMDALNLIQHHPNLYWRGYQYDTLPEQSPLHPFFTRKSLFETKKWLFENMLLAGLRQTVEERGGGTKRGRWQAVRDALEARAKNLGLPDDFFQTRAETPSILSRITGIIGMDTRRQESEAVALNALMSEEFMRLMAHDMDEMKECDDQTISIFQV